MVVLIERITSIFFIYNHVKVCSALHLEQQLFHAIIKEHAFYHLATLSGLDI